MANNSKRLLSSFNLKQKLNISFALMSIVPLLVLISTYTLSLIGWKVNIGAVLITVFIAVCGFFITREIFRRILSVSIEAKMIASGDIQRFVDVTHQDEIGQLGQALNKLTVRIRGDMVELKNYSVKTTEINNEIQKRVFLLSNLLEISSLIAQSALLDDILKVAVEKSCLVANSSVAYLLFHDEASDDFYVKVAEGENYGYLSRIRLAAGTDMSKRLFGNNKPLIVDRENTLPEDIRAAFYEKFKLNNTLAVPIYLRGKMIAVLGIGNTQGEFLYKKDDIELLNIFAKNIAIAIENNLLVRRLEKLEVKDSLTGLYNEAFIRTRLQEEIRRAIASQRPCAFVLLDIDNFAQFRQDFGALSAQDVLKKAAYLIRDSVTEIDRVARFGESEFAVLLPERNKRQAQLISEQIKKKIEFSFSEEQDVRKRIRISLGLSENPLDGIESDELISKAQKLLRSTPA